MKIEVLQDFLSHHWRSVLVYLSACAAVWKYFDARSREVAWKRTELLFQIGQQLDTDPKLQEAIKLLEGRDSRVTLQEFLAAPETELIKDGLDLRQSLDCLLNLFERVAHAVYTTKTISIKETYCFGWYLAKIKDTDLLKQYCEDNGFEDVLKLAQDVLKKSQKS